MLELAAVCWNDIGMKEAGYSSGYLASIKDEKSPINEAC